MDYCSSCRRHLNGALVCPGCGAYAPDIDPSAFSRPATAPTPVLASAEPAWEYPATESGHDGSGWDEIPLPREAPAAGSGLPEEDGSVETGTTEGYEARPEGRAARRRQMARWKKNQRRAVVATAVALVGGGLTVAGMNGNAKPGVQAAATPEDTTMGGAAGEAPTYTEPTSSRHDSPRSAQHTDRASRHQQSRAADPRTTPTAPHTDAAAAPRELRLTTSPQRRTVPDTVDTVTGHAGSAVSSGTSGATGSTGSSGSTATEPTSAPAAGTGSDAQQPTAPSTPPPAAAEPPATSTSDSGSKELCLLVICLG